MTRDVQLDYWQMFTALVKLKRFAFRFSKANLKAPPCFRYSAQCKQFMEELFKCTKLEAISFEHMRGFTDVSLSGIPPNRLVSLELLHTKVTEMGFLEFVETTKKIQRLKLSFCSEDILKALSRKCRQLQELALCPVVNGHIGALVNYLGGRYSSKCLSKLTLRMEPCVDENNMDKLIKGIGRHRPCLTELSMMCEFSLSPHSAAFEFVFKRMGALKRLCLATPVGKPLSGDLMCAIARSCCRLESLSVNYATFDCDFLPLLFSNNARLSELFISIPGQLTMATCKQLVHEECKISKLFIGSLHEIREECVT